MDHQASCPSPWNPPCPSSRWSSSWLLYQAFSEGFSYPYIGVTTKNNLEGTWSVLVQGLPNVRLKDFGHLGPDQYLLIGISDRKQLQINTNTVTSDIGEWWERVIHLHEETLGEYQCSPSMLLVFLSSLALALSWIFNTVYGSNSKSSSCSSSFLLCMSISGVWTRQRQLPHPS